MNWKIVATLWMVGVSLVACAATPAADTTPTTPVAGGGVERPKREAQDEGDDPDTGKAEEEGAQKKTVGSTDPGLTGTGVMVPDATKPKGSK